MPCFSEKYLKNNAKKILLSQNHPIQYFSPLFKEMSERRINNSDLPNLFKKVINNLEFYYQTDLSDSKKTFAMQHLYSKKISQIEEKIGEL